MGRAGAWGSTTRRPRSVSPSSRTKGTKSWPSAPRPWSQTTSPVAGTGGSRVTPSSVSVSRSRMGRLCLPRAAPARPGREGASPPPGSPRDPPRYTGTPCALHRIQVLPPEAPCGSSVFWGWRSGRSPAACGATSICLLHLRLRCRPLPAPVQSVRPSRRRRPSRECRSPPPEDCPILVRCGAACTVLVRQGRHPGPLRNPRGAPDRAGRPPRGLGRPLAQYVLWNP